MKVVCLSLLLTGFSAQAEFANHQARAIENVEKRIQTLQELKACFQSASDKGAMKKCRETKKEAMKAMKDARIDEKMERLEKRKQRLKEKRGN